MLNSWSAIDLQRNNEISKDRKAAKHKNIHILRYINSVWAYIPRGHKSACQNVVKCEVKWMTE